MNNVANISDEKIDRSHFSIAYRPVRNPRTGQKDYDCKINSSKSILFIADNIRRKNSEWNKLTIAERRKGLIGLANSIKSHADQIANALEVDTGRRKISRLEVQSVIGSIHAWVNQNLNLSENSWIIGQQNPAIKHKPQFVSYPVVGVISPWNFPLLLSFIDTIPALLAGCSVIIKPSEITPRFIEPLNFAIRDSGLGDYLEILEGDGSTGSRLIEVVDAICFTGSVSTGRKVSLAAAKRLIPAFLELGGKDPLIVLESANLDQASDAAIRGSVLSTGQACQSIERIYVHSSIADAFLKLLLEKANKVRLNWPDTSIGDIGPIISENQAKILQEHIKDARQLGAKILTGGKIENLGGGLWLRPTVISKVNHNMKVMREETFGPVLPVMTYNTIDEAVALANDTEYGLSAAVMAGNLDEAESIGRHIDAGAISLNDASLTSLFYEAEKHSFKHSGLGGSRMGIAGFHRFLQRKALIANTSTPSTLSDFSED